MLLDHDFLKPHLANEAAATNATAAAAQAAALSFCSNNANHHNNNSNTAFASASSATASASGGFGVVGGGTPLAPPLGSFPEEGGSFDNSTTAARGGEGGEGRSGNPLQSTPTANANAGATGAPSSSSSSSSSSAAGGSSRRNSYSNSKGLEGMEGDMQRAELRQVSSRSHFTLTCTFTSRSSHAHFTHTSRSLHTYSSCFSPHQSATSFSLVSSLVDPLTSQHLYHCVVVVVVVVVVFIVLYRCCRYRRLCAYTKVVDSLAVRTREILLHNTRVRAALSAAAGGGRAAVKDVLEPLPEITDAKLVCVVVDVRATLGRYDKR